MELLACAVERYPGDFRSFLAKFLFVGDDVYKQVLDLSGGEREDSLSRNDFPRQRVGADERRTIGHSIARILEALEAYEGTI